MLHDNSVVNWHYQDIAARNSSAGGSLLKGFWLPLQDIQKCLWTFQNLKKYFLFIPFIA